MAYVLQQLLSKSAKAYPEKMAVWARGRSITYRDGASIPAPEKEAAIRDRAAAS